MKNIYLSLLILFSLSIFAQENEEAGEWAAADIISVISMGYDMHDLMRVVSVSLIAFLMNIVRQAIMMLS